MSLHPLNPCTIGTTLNDCSLSRSVSTVLAEIGDGTETPSSPAVLFDEKLPGPYYGLPSIDEESIHQLVTYPDHQAKTRDLPSQQREFLEMLSLAADQNANLPIHTLPAELLIQIFREFLPSPPLVAETRGKLKRPWARLMFVCRHWCALIRNTACFWRDIEVRTKDLRWLNLALRRLGDAGARIAIFRDLDPILSIVMEHAENIQRLSFQGHTRGSLAATLLSHPFPILDTLELSLERLPYSHVGRLPRFRCENSPRLATVKLVRVSFPWSSSILARLEVLSLARCQITTPPLPFANFLAVLEHGQKLRELRLLNFLSIALSRDVSRARRITLTKLRHLTCHDSPARVRQLMEHLHTPALQELDLEGEGGQSQHPLSRGQYLSILALKRPHVSAHLTIHFLGIPRAERRD